MGTYLPRCGDHVAHGPSGEDWLVAWAEGEDLASAGWPCPLGRLADCTVTYRCSDAEHARAVEGWRRASPGGHRERVLRLYGGER